MPDLVAPPTLPCSAVAQTISCFVAIFVVRCRSVALSRSSSPHPIPLPRGEGDSFPAFHRSARRGAFVAVELQQGRANTAARLPALPLPRGEGRGEGEVSANSFDLFYRPTSSLSVSPKILFLCANFRRLQEGTTSHKNLCAFSCLLVAESVWLQLCRAEPYRRVPLGQAHKEAGAQFSSTTRQNGILRYGRLQVCATAYPAARQAHTTGLAFENPSP